MVKLRAYFVICFCLFFCHFLNGQIWLAKNATMKFYSSTPLENIEAVSKAAAGAINAKTGRIFFQVSMKTFHFEKALMEEHFNENYIESHKFPNAEFDGYIIDMPKLDVDGVYPVKVNGKFSLHGTTTEREATAILKVADGKIYGSSNFKVSCSEYNIRIPKVVRNNISEMIDVTIQAVFLLKN